MTWPDLVGYAHAHRLTARPVSDLLDTDPPLDATEAEAE